jgi:low affinity Fe/Cu permease
MKNEERSTRMTRAISHIAGSLGSFPAILFALGIVVVWLGIGMLSGKSRTDVFNMLTMFATVSTFVMVFIIQNTQNREDRANQTKMDAQDHALRQILDRLGIEHEHPLSRLAGLEEAPEEDIKQQQEDVRPRPDGASSSTGPHATQAG